MEFALSHCVISDCLPLVAMRLIIRRCYLQKKIISKPMSLTILCLVLFLFAPRYCFNASLIMFRYYAKLKIPNEKYRARKKNNSGKFVCAYFATCDALRIWKLMLVIICYDHTFFFCSAHNLILLHSFSVCRPNGGSELIWLNWLVNQVQGWKNGNREMEVTFWHHVKFSSAQEEERTRDKSTDNKNNNNNKKSAICSFQPHIFSSLHNCLLLSRLVHLVWLG